MLNSPGQALAFVRKHGIVTMTRSARPSLVETVAGGPVKGSWWAHPKGKLIFRLAESLHDSSEVLALKLVDGKVTFVHRTIWPALCRLVTDPEWRMAGERRLSPAARELLREVERLKELRLDRVRAANSKSLKKAREELERSLLVRSGSIHTEKGSHATVLESWTFDQTTRAKAKRLALDESRALLGLA